MEDLLRRWALDKAKDQWHTRTGLVTALITVALSLVILFAGVDLDQVSPREWIIILLILLGIYIIWTKTTVPRVPKGRVGFGVAIEFEDSDHERKLRSDFVLKLRDLLMASPRSHQFSFLELPKGLANQLTDQEKARSLAIRANLRFLLYGRARLRMMPQGSAHVIDLHGLVRHAPVRTEVSRQFGADIGVVLPHQMIVGPEGNIFACEFAARHIDAVARFVIGTAATLSQDFQYAEELLLDSERLFKLFVDQAEGSPVSVWLDRVQSRIRELYQLWMEALVNRYTSLGEIESLRNAEQIGGKLGEYDPNNYGLRLWSAICAFTLHRDLAQARKEIEACRNMQDGAWMYSEAFLDAYGGDLRSAYRCYRGAFQSPLQDQAVPIQCEEFIQRVLDEEPQRYWLYYCLGLINYRAKGDFRRLVTTSQSSLNRLIHRSSRPK